jgi:hypothetical protein
MVDPYSAISTVTTNVVIKLRSKQTTHFPKYPFPVPIMLIPQRGRFITVPEVMHTLVAKGYKPNLINTIDIEIPARVRGG